LIAEGLRLLETIQKLLMDAIKSAVAKDNDDISGLSKGPQTVNNRIGSGFVEGGLAGVGDLLNDTLGIQSLILGQLVQAGDLSYENAISLSKGFRKVILKNGSASCVRAGLK
jgi:hypothetical protein